jgi:hypothetical protein
MQTLTAATWIVRMKSARHFVLFEGHKIRAPYIFLDGQPHEESYGVQAGSVFT